MKKMIAVGALVIITVVLVYSCGQAEAKKSPETETISQDSLIKRGQYLVTIMGCNDCHTPFKMTPQGPVKDMDRMLSGHPSQMPVFKFDTATTKNYVLFNMISTSTVGPWGVSFAANLTSDETGIGNWSIDQFRKAFIKGKFMGLDEERNLLPPMPWENYANIKDEDVQAIFAYLKSTKPVRNVVPGAIPPNELGKYILK